MHTITVGQKQPNTKYDFVENCFGIIEQNNQLLLVKQKGQHSFIGGRIEKGESQEQCLKREFLEESGLTITKIIPLCTVDCFWLADGKWPLETLAHFFCVQVDFKNKAQPTQADCTLEFVSIEQAQNVLPLPYQQKALQVFLQTRNTYSIKTHATEQDLHQMLKLDDEYYANSYKGQFDLCKQWLEKNNQIYTMLLFENQIVGYINFMPLTKSAYILFKNGLITDEQIQPKHITGFDKTHCGLFASVVVDKNHRKAFKMLFNAFFEKLKQNNTKKFVCTAVSAQGKAILKFVQHKQVGTDAQNNAVYEVYLN